MNGRVAAANVARTLRASGDTRRAAAEKRYLKSEMTHLGVGVPRLRAIVKAFLREHPEMDRTDLLAIAGDLWSKTVFEQRMAAVEILVLKRDLLRSSDLRAVERLIRDSGTWALVDTLASTLAGGLVERFPALTATLDRWARDDAFWIRRSALLALLVPLRRGEGDFKRFGRYADAMLDEREFFIRKAIGWVLRETSKKRPDIVYAWLEPRAARASGVTVREAVKYLSEEQRETVLNGHVTARGRPSSGIRRPVR